MSETIKTLLKITLVSLAITGYAMCVVKFITCDFETPFRAEVFYGIGAFSPLGIILGWFNFGR